MRKPLHEGAAYFTVDLRISERVLDNTCNGPVDCRSKGLPKAGALLLVSSSSVEEFRLGLRPKNRAECHVPRTSF